MISMAVKTTLSYKVERIDDEMVVPPLLSMKNGGGTNMNDNDNVTFKDLKIAEERLNSKIDVSNTKLSGKIDTSEAKLSGKIDVTNAKLDSLNGKLADQATRLNWLMGLVIGSILVPIAIKLIFK